jgi:hypothetical protein
MAFCFRFAVNNGKHLHCAAFMGFDGKAAHVR